MVISLVIYLICLQFHTMRVRVTAITAGSIFIIAMGLSRVFLGHHWLTDVMAGWILGLAWVAIVILAHRLFHLVRRREHAGAAPSFDRPIVRDVVADELHDGEHSGRGKGSAE
ncbi:phosphatase PAP2 family protein [Arthrobacter sp. FX8]|uniref:phosphatase PAP2 family protein n=1 Tax=Arthrobacter sp. FX8 TaxID=2997335 RepID=UPI003FA34A5E